MNYLLNLFNLTILLTMKNRQVYLSILIFFSVSSSLLSQSYHPVTAKHGMVVSTNHIASQTGIDIMKKGGNAIDAAIATAFTLAVVYPSCGNIGGGGFMLIHLPNGIVTSIDFRMVAPKNVTLDMFFDLEKREYRPSGIDGLEILDSPKAIGVPGTVAGLEMAHMKYGRLSWIEVIQPAIDLAENGFPVGAALHKEMVDSKKYFELFPSSKLFFLKKDGSVYEVGETWKQPVLAYTLEQIARNGKEAFYNSSITKKMVEEIQKYGGCASINDFNNYEAIERAPVKGSYRGYDFYGMPLPSSGGITELETLNILENFNLKQYGQNSAQHLHLLTEAFKLAFRDRAIYLGDPDFITTPYDKLTSKEYGNGLAEGIDIKTAWKPDVSELYNANESKETTHFSVIDQDGMAVSVTYSLNGDFGAYLVPEGTGVVLNNTMGDFNFAPGLQLSSGNMGTKPNWIEPGKRPLSSMTPTILAKDGKAICVLGSPGGPTIITTNVQIIVNLIDFEYNIAEAIAAPRIYHGWLPDQLLFQKTTATSDTRTILQSMGHKILVFDDLYFGPAMGIWIDYETGLRYGACDPRSMDGRAAGY